MFNGDCSVPRFVSAEELLAGRKFGGIVGI